MSNVNRAEVINRLGRTGVSSLEAISAIEVLDIEFVDLDKRLADRAAALRTRHYHRERRAVSLADCAALATAIELSSGLATSDTELAGMAREEHVTISPIANSRGVRP